ncbi:Scr1 family TA system antitoxin-like transcriptional regulator [Streptomyces sp. NPDC093085]
MQPDQAHEVAFVDAEARLNQYRMLVERLDGMALPEAESRDFIHEIAENL